MQDPSASYNSVECPLPWPQIQIRGEHLAKEPLGVGNASDRPVAVVPFPSNRNEGLVRAPVIGNEAREHAVGDEGAARRHPANQVPIAQPISALNYLMEHGKLVPAEGFEPPTP